MYFRLLLHAALKSGQVSPTKVFTLTFHLCPDESNTIHLKIVPSTQDPPLVLEHHVPMFLADKNSYNYSQWDLTTQQVSTSSM